MDSVRSGPFGQIFRPDNFVFGEYSIHDQECISMYSTTRLLCYINIFLLIFRAEWSRQQLG